MFQKYNYVLNFEIVLLLDHVTIFFSFRVTFRSTGRAELDFSGFVIKVALNFKSRGNEKFKFSSQGTYVGCKVMAKRGQYFASILSRLLNEFE